MTISTLTNRISFSTDGSSVDFVTDFPVLVETDLFVYLVNGATSTLLTLTTDYTVAGALGDVATVTTVVTYPNDGSEILIVRDVPLTQETDYVNNDKNDAEVQERALDKATMGEQQLNTLIQRSLRLNESTTASFDMMLPYVDIQNYAGLGLIINETGDGIAAGTPSATFVPAGGRFLGIAKLTTSTGDFAYTTGPDTTLLKVGLLGGAGGGGASGTSASSNSSAGAAGGGAEFLEFWVVTTPNTVLTGHVGDGGAGGTNPNGDGDDGVATTIIIDGHTYTAIEGGGGPGAANDTINQAVGIGGTFSGPFLHISDVAIGLRHAGHPGTFSTTYTDTGGVFVIGGYGGAGGNIGKFTPGKFSNSTSVGNDGDLGCGGSPGISRNNAGSAAGGDGGGGLAYIEEWIGTLTTATSFS